jgi:uncharacterized protein (TIGR02099 family)
MLRNTPPSQPQDMPQKRLPGFGNRWRKRLLILGGVIFTLFVVGHLGIRFILWPQIEKSKPALEKLVSARLGADITMDDVQVSWTGIRPSFEIQGLKLNGPDASSSPLYIDNIRGQLSWVSFYRLAPYFHEITISKARLFAQRDAKGHIYIAGIPIKSSGESNFSTENWILGQSDIDISNVEIFWKDDQSRKLETAFTVQKLLLSNGIRSHEGELVLISPWAESPIEIKADFVHRLTGQAGNWKDWAGNFSWNFSSLNLTQLSKDVALPLHALEGIINSQANLRLDSGKPDGGEISVSADRLKIQKNTDDSPIEFGRIETKLIQDENDGMLSISTKSLAWRSTKAADTAPLDNLSPMTFRWKPPKKDEEIKEFGFSSPKVMIQDVALFAMNLPLPKKIHRWIKDAEASGELQNVNLDWKEKVSPLAALPVPGAWFDANKLSFKVNANLIQVNFNSLDPEMPAVSNLTGVLSSNQDQGSFSLNSDHLKITIEQFLNDPHIALDQATGNIDWIKQKNGWQINAKQLSLTNSELTTNLSLNYLLSPPKIADQMTLDMTIDQAQLKSVHKYLPVGMNLEIRQYLSKAFGKGFIQNGSLHIKGDPNQVPYPNRASGEFSLNLPIVDTTFNPSPLLPLERGIWSALENMSGTVSMDQAALLVDINQANFKSVKLTAAKAQIKDVSAKNLMLTLNTQLNGEAPEILEYLYASPFGKKEVDIAKNLRVNGLVNGTLDANIPLGNKGDLKIDAKVSLPDNTARWGKLPPLEKLKGKIRITEMNPEFEDISANFLGGSIRIASAPSSPGNSAFSIHGDVDAKLLQGHFAPNPILQAMSGTAKYEGSINFNEAGNQTKIQFDLRNWMSAAPYPMNKSKGMPLTGAITIRSFPRGESNSVRLDWTGNIGDKYFTKGMLERNKELRYALGIGADPSLPIEGINLTLVSNELDLDAWQDLFISQTKQSKGLSKTTGTTDSNIQEEGIELVANIKKLTASDRQWDDVNVVANDRNGAWNITLDSLPAKGSLKWHKASELHPNSQVTGQLSKLHVPELIPKNASSDIKISETKLEIKRVTSPNSLPSIDITVDDFGFSKALIGQVKIKARSTFNAFRIESLNVNGPDGTSSIKGEWISGVNGKQDHTSISADIVIKNAGAIISHWSKTQAVEGGQGTLTASVEWDAPIYKMDYPTLIGSVKLNLSNGRLLEVNSDAAKLLNVLSLQSLLKFATLDLQGSLGNLVTKGTAFNTISSNFKIGDGILRTSDFSMVLDQAKVAMNGQIDLSQETQDLRITIFPTIDATAGSLAAFVINPIVGIGAVIGQYLITNQINKTMQSDYLVQGSWENPEVIPLNQQGQPLDQKTLDSIRKKPLLKEQTKPNIPDSPGVQPEFAPTSN